ncbi:hypothetical protein AB0F71_25025 [Kitasatospora sp. NPDC028055]|uniref:hypothetical protein n=1 Tax=Kitasatospora sp. NPDC028055 TaxID=3155653 RepID=UPI0033C23D37
MRSLFNPSDHGPADPYESDRSAVPLSPPVDASPPARTGEAADRDVARDPGSGADSSPIETTGMQADGQETHSLPETVGPAGWQPRSGDRFEQAPVQGSGQTTAPAYSVHEEPADSFGAAARYGNPAQDTVTPPDADSLQRLLADVGSQTSRPPVGPAQTPDLGEGDDNVEENVGSSQSDERPPSSAPSVTQSITGANNGTVIGIQLQNIINRMRNTDLRRAWVEEQLAVYVPPENEEEATTVLLRENVLVLIGDTGTGRQTTALHLLRGLSGKGLTLKRFLREPDDPFAMDDLAGQRGVGWILDLRAEGDTVSRLGYSLQKTALLKDAGSYLVVLASPQLWETVGQGGDHAAVTLEAAEAKSVLRAYLAAAPECADPGLWIDNPRIAQAIAGRLPGEVKRWADAIREEERRPATALLPSATADDAEAAFNERIDRVIEARADWRNQLRDWHIGHPDSDHRNYLLAAAAMDGAPVEKIYPAAESLAEALGETPVPRPGQQGPGIIELTHMIGAVLSADGSVTLPSEGYAEAVVEYFLVDRAHLVDLFTQWTATQAVELEGDLGLQLADRVAEWVLRHTQKTRSVALLKSVTTQWSAKKVLREHARDLLSVAAVDAGAGRMVRNKILEWARKEDEPVALRATLAAVCRQVSQVYPREALLRLDALAESGNQKITDAVGKAINEMWDNPDQRKKVRSVLRSWAANSKATVRSSGSHAFLHLAGRSDEDGTPSLLAGEDKENDLPWIVQSWRTALEHDPLPDPAVVAFSVWMDGADTAPDARDAVFNVFARAVHDGPDENRAVRFLSLNRLATHWEPSEPTKPLTERARLRDELITCVRQADPANSGSHSGVPQT